MEGKLSAEVVLYSCVSSLGSRNYHPAEWPMHQLGEMEGLVRNSIVPHAKNLLAVFNSIELRF